MKLYFAAALALIAAANGLNAAAIEPQSIDPAYNATVEALQSVTITYSAGSAVTVSKPDLIHLSFEATPIAVEASVHPRKTNVVAVAPADAQPLTAAGQYYFLAEAGAFVVDGTPSSEISCSYTVGSSDPDTPDTPQPVAPLDYISVNPAPGVVNLLSSWEILISTEFAKNFDNRSAKYHLTCSNPEVELPELRWQSTEVSLADGARLTAPGTYTLTMDEGMFLIGPEEVAVPNPRIDFVYVIEEGADIRPFPDYTINPAPGYYKSLGEIVFTFDTDEAVSVDASAVSLTGSTSTIPVNVMESGSNYFTVSPASSAGKPATLTTDGTYVLIIEAGAITVGNSFNSRSIGATYTVSPRAGQGNWTGEYVASPADGAEVESLSRIRVDFTGAADVRVNEFATPSQFPTLYNEAGTAVTQGSVFATLSEIEISLFNAATIPGSYKLVIPKEFLIIDGVNPPSDIRLSYSVAANAHTGKYSYTTVPTANGTLGFADPIEIIFEGDGLTSVTHNEYAWGATAPRFSSVEGNYCPGVQTVKLSDFVFSFNHIYPFEVPGNYTLTVPAGFFTFGYSDGISDPGFPIEITFNVSNNSSLEAPTATNDDTPIYFDLNGQRILSPTPGVVYIRVVGGKATKMRK